jgi:uncharacterized integral membrane protein
MFFNKKYGNLGMLTMPFAFISIFVALFFTSQYIKALAITLYDKFLELKALGIHFHPGIPHWEWFTFNVEFRRLIIYVLFSVTIMFVLLGGRMATRKLHFSRNMLYFILLYGFIAPFWLVKSLYNFITTKDATWR